MFSSPPKASSCPFPVNSSSTSSRRGEVMKYLGVSDPSHATPSPGSISQHVGSQFPHQGSHLCLLRWKHEVLTRELPWTTRELLTLRFFWMCKLVQLRWKVVFQYLIKFYVYWLWPRQFYSSVYPQGKWLFTRPMPECSLQFNSSFPQTETIPNVHQ